MVFNRKPDFLNKYAWWLGYAQLLYVDVEEKLFGKHSQGRNAILRQREMDRLCGRWKPMKDMSFTHTRLQLP